MREKIIDFIYKSLSTDTTPLAYLITIHSLIFGASFLLFPGAESVKATLLYQAGALVGIPLWGTIITFAGVALILGMLSKNVAVVEVGSLGLFVGWLFAAITYFMGGLWLQMIMAIILMLCFGYHSLAASIGHLWNYTPADY